jgi:hypothetical protein
MSKAPKPGQLVTVNITVAADNPLAASKIVSDKLLSYLPALYPEDPVDRWDFEGAQAGALP